MSAAREAILGRIAAALGDPAPRADGGTEVASWSHESEEKDLEALIALFIARTKDHGAGVTLIARGGGDDAVREAIAAACDRHAAREVGVPAGFPGAWIDGSLRLTVVETVSRDDLPALDRLDAALTRSAMAVAETGTVVLDGGPGQGPRALSLLPDVLVCVVDASSLVSRVRDGVGAMAGTRRPLTLISGPSATSDIELSRVEGVHGPRRLEVVVRG